MSVDSRFRGNDGSGVSRFLHTLFLGDDDKARGCFVLAALVALLALPLAARADNPTSARASNTGPADTQSTIAPALPQPDVGPDAGPFAYLRAARVALATGQTGKAQQALEMAETRMLDRSTPLFQTNDPSRNPLVADISAARHALGAGDAGGAMSAIDQALALQHR